MKKMLTIVVPFIAGIVTVVSVAACVPPTEPEPTPVEYPSITLVACPMEDSDNCYWDADTMGNGTGTDFVTIDGVTYYPKAD